MYLKESKSIFTFLTSCEQRLVQDLYRIFDQVNNEESTSDKKLPESFREFLLEIKDNHYDARTFAVRLKATV
jgi:alpha-1,4-galacturonosyltransferase